MKSIAQQERDAEATYKEAFRRHPKAARTTVLWHKWCEAKRKLIALQSHRVPETQGTQGAP